MVIYGYTYILVDDWQGEIIVKPSIALNSNRDAVREVVGRYKGINPRVFGSTAHGSDTEKSDLDILVDALPDTTLFDLGGMQSELEEMLGVKVEVLTLGDLPEKFRDQVLAEAQPV